MTKLIRHSSYYAFTTNILQNGTCVNQYVVNPRSRAYYTVGHMKCAHSSGFVVVWYNLFNPISPLLAETRAVVR